ncbi:MAG TPA: hypothetical protein VH113_02555 [Gemmatimonadales bacterium]|jgi:hypothetical protein|nr:hypothetical protein [Gemmatimonadales bacterium]
MNVRISSVIVIALAGAAACKSNPLADGAGAPAQILINFDTVAISVGGKAAVQAMVVDSRLTPLPVTITFSVCSGGGGIASVAVDGTYHPIPATSAQAIVTGAAVGSTCVQAASSGLKPASAAVVVSP